MQHNNLSQYTSININKKTNGGPYMRRDRRERTRTTNFKVR